MGARKNLQGKVTRFNLTECALSQLGIDSDSVGAEFAGVVLRPPFLESWPVHATPPITYDLAPASFLPIMSDD